MNLNRLFPRLSITAKLAIAFVLLALVPLTLVSVLGTIFTVRQMRERESDLLEHDLETVGARTARSLDELVQQMRYVSDLGLRDCLLDSVCPVAEDLAQSVRTYLVADSSALFRVKAVSALGRVILQASLTDDPDRSPTDALQPFYSWLASGLAEGETTLAPVELRTGSGGLVPAVAIVRAVHDTAGRLRGALVGEASAAGIFSGLDHSSPDVSGITGLVDGEGRFLYHTRRKKDWATLLARRNEETVVSDLPRPVAAAILSGQIGTIRTDQRIVVTYRPLEVPGLAAPPFALYRTFSQATLGRAVRQFLAATGVAALVIVLSVLGVAVIAARQITRPLHLLQKAARQVTGGASHEPLSIETNDEIQDLSEDFERMASEVARHRRRLESAVDERTRELRRTEAELSRIVSLSADGIVGLDPAGKVRLWNRGAEHLFGFTPAETRNRFLDDLILPDGPRGRREQAYLQRILEKTGAVIGHQTLRRTKSGELVPVGITQTLLEDENGEPTGSSVIFRDSRMQEQIQEQMRRSERLSAMSVMAAGLAHELNNPVAVLDNRLELMQREAATSDDGDSLRKDLGVLREQVRRVGSITGDLLRFSRDDTDEISPLQVNDVVLQVIRLLDRVVAAEGVGLKYELDEDLPLASASATSVETILVNLVLNASQACAPEGSITVLTRSRQRLKLVEVEVRDDGPGVPDALRSRIFEPFFTTRADRGGTGLGLAVCRALMERNGGTIHLKGGNGGRGAVFVLGLPSAEPNDDD